jgi:hypothetical protein
MLLTSPFCACVVRSWPLCVSTVTMRKMTDFYEVLQEYYTTTGHDIDVFFNFLQSVIKLRSCALFYDRSDSSNTYSELMK